MKCLNTAILQSVFLPPVARYNDDHNSTENSVNAFQIEI